MASPTKTEGQDHPYLSLLKSIKTIDVDWDKFATEMGITSGRGNAQRKLKQALKKDGLQLSANTIIPLDDNSGEKKTKAVAKDVKTPVKNTKGAAKRKAKDDDGDEEYEAAGSKKKSKVQATVESDNEDVVKRGLLSSVA